MKNAEANTVSHETSQPLVSAVIPTRNRPDLVCRAVRSALAQTYPNIEVIVVIDGPDPASFASLEVLGDPRIRIIALEESVGGSEARNTGAREAQGSYIALLDDDDEWLPEKIATQVAIAAKSTARGTVVMCGFLLRSSDGRDTLRPRRMLRPGESAAEYIFDPAGGFKTSTFLCSRDLLLAVPFTRGLRGCQDPDWLLKVVAAGDHRFIIADQMLAVYYAPASVRNVTRTLDLNFKLDWIRSHRKLMTRRAYSLFILSMCAPTVAERRFPIRQFFWLLRECLFRGSANLNIFLHFMSLFFLPLSLRHRIRNFIDKIQKSRRSMSGSALIESV